MNKKIAVLTIVALVLFAGVAPAYAQYWEDFVDRAYRFTFSDREFLRQNIEKYEQRYGETLHDYNSSLLEKVSTKGRSAVAVELGEADIIRDQPSVMYLRAAVGQLLEYLTSNKKQYLNNAMLLISELKDSYDAKRDYLFWALFIKGHKQLAENDRSGLIDTIYSLWQKVIVPLHQERKGAFALRGRFASDFAYHCVNVLNLAIDKAIIDKRMAGLFPVGPVVANITEMLPENEEYYRNIMNRFQGRSSDSANINYTVAFAVGEATAAALRDTLPASEYERLFKESLYYFDLAYEWADTDKGRAAVLTQKSILLYIIWSVKLNKSDAVDTPYFGNELNRESQKNIDSSYELYSRLANSRGNRKDVIYRNGFFADSDEYLTTMKNLWQETGNLVQQQAAFLGDSGREDLMDWADLNNAEHIVFAHKYFSQDGYQDIIPETAYFQVGENIAQLAAKIMEEASDTPTVESQRMAYSFFTYATILNPLSLYDLVEFSAKTSDADWSDYSRQYFVPMGQLLASTVNMCAADDRYSEYQRQLASLSENVVVYFQRLPQVVGFLRAGTTRSVAVRDSIILANLFDALYPAFSIERVKKEMAAFCESGGLDNPAGVLQEKVAADMAGKLSENAGNGRKFDPYDYYALYRELRDKPGSKLHLFLERLYYANRSALQLNDHWKLKSVQDYVIKASQGIMTRKYKQ